MKKSVSMILCIIMVLTVLLSTNFYLYRVNDMKLIASRDKSIQMINDMEWNFILDTIKENREKGNLLSTSMSKQIEDNVSEEYPDLSILKSELINNTPDTKFSKIVRDTFDGVYMNDIHNDNNDPWAAMSWGINGDFSPNCSKLGDRRTWDIEISMHWNKIIAKQAIDNLLALNDKVLFWEFLKPEANVKHKQITEMSLTELKKVFQEEGVEGLKTYEFLCPSYITPKGDIFGVPDVGSGGIKNLNDKVIIIQGFNLYDQLKKDHSDSLKNFDERRKEVLTSYENDNNFDITQVVMSGGMLFLAILALVFIYNRLYDLQVYYTVVNKDNNTRSK